MSSEATEATPRPDPGEFAGHTLSPVVKAALPAFLSDVRVGLGPVPSTLDGATAAGVLWQAMPGSFLLDVPRVARYLVTDGCSVTVDTAPEAMSADVVRFLRMAPLAALLYQRGVLALHGAAAAGPRGAVVLAGDSGCGKSTLLVELIRRGWLMLADDLAAVSVDQGDDPVVRPTFGEAMLWPDALEGLNRIDPGRPRFSPDVVAGNGAVSGRQVVALASRIAPGPLPLREIWQLATHNEQGIEVSEVSGAARLAALGRLSYNSQIASSTLSPAAYLSLAGAVAGRVPVRRLIRPRGRWSVDELADIVQDGAA